MLLTSDIMEAIRQPYQIVNINYFPTSAQQLYRLETTGEWLNYTGQPLKLIHGQTIYAKGIDKYGSETRIISSYTVNAADALKKEAYDGDDSTFTNLTNQYILVDDSVQNKSIRVLWNGGSNYGYPGVWYYYYSVIRFLDENDQEISNVKSPSSYIEQIFKIPANTKKIKYENASYGGRLYEIQLCNEPIISATTVYMLLTSDSTKAIRESYQNITISYFETSVQRLYRIGTTGEWLNYTDQPIKVDKGQTIYTKGIDKYGSETRLISSYTSSVPDSLQKEAFDGDYSTRTGTPSIQYINVDESMLGKNIRVKFAGSYYNTYSGWVSTSVSLSFLNENSSVISSYSSGSTSKDLILAVPGNTKRIKFGLSTNSAGSYPSLYEIQPSNIPAISVTPTVSTNGNVTAVINSLFETDTKKYSFDSTNWYTYTSPLNITSNKTIYAKVIDSSNIEYTSTITVTNIDKTSPTVAFATNGQTNVKTASTKVTLADTGTSGINITSLQYVWDTQNIAEPSSGWTTFTNAAILSKGSVNGVYYLWIKANDNAENTVISCSNAFIVDNIAPENPVMSANTTDWTNSNVTVTITYPSDTVTKQYSTNGTTWIAYTTPVIVSANNTTVYAKRNRCGRKSK